MTASRGQDGREVIEEYADITRESYRTVVGRAFAARESNLCLSRDFFERTVVEIQEQTRLSRHASQELWDHTRRQGEALGELAEATTDVYEELQNATLENPSR